MANAVIPPGKLPAALLRSLLASVAGNDDGVLLGPALGEDACVLEVPGGVLVVTTDPITLTTAEIGRYAVAVNANDVAACGVRPRWFLATVLLPEGTTEGAVVELFDVLRTALVEAGVALVGGHTEVTAAVRQPVVVGQMLGIAEDGRYVTTGGARPGDLVVQVGPAPVEGAAVLAASAGDRLTSLPADLLAAAAAAVTDPGISIVDAALAAAAAGATAMHDPTEGGLAGGLHELAAAAGVGLEIESAAVRWFEPGVAVCRELGADPWATLASGSLLATFPPDVAVEAVAALAACGATAIIGSVHAGRGVRVDGRALPWPERDELTRVLG